MNMTLMCDHCGGCGMVRAWCPNPDRAICDVDECPVCRGETTVEVAVDLTDARAVLAALRRRPLVDATDPKVDAEIEGTEAVNELGAIRALLDAALAAL